VRGCCRRRSECNAECPARTLAEVNHQRLINASSLRNRLCAFGVILDVVNTGVRRVGLSALIACLAACSSGGGKQSTPTTPSKAIATTHVPPSTTAPALPIRAVARGCSEADLQRHIGTMPTPHAVSRRFVLDPNGAAWLDPSGNTAPTVSAREAWGELTTGSQRDSYMTFGGGRPQLLLGYFTSPSSGPGPKGFAHILSWVIYKTHTAVGPGDGPGPSPIGPSSAGVTTTPTILQPICSFGTAYSALDATTGNGLIVAVF
jgi:hypothetical protein